MIAYGVTQRRQEIAIRMALGAQPHVVSSAILREAVVLAFVGIAAGIASALALQRVAAGFVFGVTPTDLPTFAAVVIVLVGTCLLASYIPARRAARVDPIVSLKGG